MSRESLKNKLLDRESARCRASGSVLLTHDVGLHARPSLILTKLAKRFACQIRISTDEAGPWIDAKSIAKVMKMKAPKGAVLFFEADGADAQDAVTSLVVLVERDFIAE